MALTSSDQILLVPQERYWDWVQAAREFAVYFGVTLTPDRDSAGRFRSTPHTVSIIDYPGAWPDDSVAWFREHYPAVRLDLLAVQKPETLSELLAERIARNDPAGDTMQTLTLLWPTDYPVITQPFGVNEAYYRRFGLPGHEGVDIRALMSTPIYACAAGRVYLVQSDPGNHAYGAHVRIRHEGGYRTVYAHLARALVHEGQSVGAGQQIGLADSTGNSSGSHLHLTLKSDGATERGETIFPGDIIDPTPFLIKPGERPPVAGEGLGWGPGVCLVGVHGRADGPLVAADYPVLQAARVEAVKLLANAHPDCVQRLRALNPDVFLLARLYADFRGGRRVDPDEFVQWQVDDIRRMYDRGVRYFEVHNEPNLTIEGWGANWRNGDGFESWYLDVVAKLRPRFAEAKFGFPGCSPGEDAEGVRQDMWRFLEQCETAIAESDWVGVHCYWRNADEMLSAEHGLGFLEYRSRWPDKLLFVTEFSNPSAAVDSQTKGDQYVQYYRLLRHRAGLGAAFCFVLSASSGVVHETWRAEDGRATAIPDLVGARDF